MSDIVNKTKAKLAPVVWGAMILASSMQTVMCNTIWGASDTAASTIWGFICQTYQKWAWIGFFFCLVMHFISKDEKKSEIYKRICIGIAIGYVVTFLSNIFLGSLDAIGQAFGGSTSYTPPSGG